jgi:threonine dehydrogenase-like Zn-dependent dehydrogenase
MKALRLDSVNELYLVDIEKPMPADDELLVRTGATLICTSDLNDLRKNPFGIALPVVMGHEAAGTVVGMGVRVKGFKPGDRIAAHPVRPCYKCASCREGRAHLCDDMKHFGINMQGTFAEYFVVRHDRARRVPSQVSFETAALAEPVSVCL